MKTRPILFSAPMVHAILDGTKTQTRRIVRGAGGSVAVTKDVIGTQPNDLWWIAGAEAGGSSSFVRCPYGLPGDHLWVRETWALLTGNGHRLVYRADGEPITNDPQTGKRVPVDPMRWTPSIFMRRHQSRITLEITSVRVERLQAITEEDARAEGIHEFRLPNGSIFGVQGVRGDDVGSTAVEAYATLWDQINASRAPWSSNPWVWVVSFKRLEGT